MGGKMQITGNKHLALVALSLCLVGLAFGFNFGFLAKAVSLGWFALMILSLRLRRLDSEKKHLIDEKPEV
jgi:hypothetical protein